MNNPLLGKTTFVTTYLPCHISIDSAFCKSSWKMPKLLCVESTLSSKMNVQVVLILNTGDGQSRFFFMPGLEECLTRALLDAEGKTIELIRN